MTVDEFLDNKIYLADKQFSKIDIILDQNKIQQ